MKSLKSIISLKKTQNDWGILFDNEKKLIAQCLQLFGEFNNGKIVSENIVLQCVLTRVFKKKTRKQLGYLYASVLPAFYDWMQEMGYCCSDAEKKEQLKMHPEINFTRKMVCFFTGEIQDRPRSFSEATREEMSDIIDKLIRLGCDFGIEIETPEAYKKRNGIIESEW